MSHETYNPETATRAEYEAALAHWQRLEYEYYSQPVPDPGIPRPGPRPQPPISTSPGRGGDGQDGDPTSGGGGGGGSQEETFNAVEQVLSENPWLRELPGIYELLSQMVIDDLPTASMAAEIRKTDVWRNRFAGIVTLQSQGLPPISEAEYLSIENQYYNQLNEARLLPLLGLNTKEAFQGWAAERIGGGVSPLELNRRLDQGIALAQEAESLVRDTFQAFYGVEPTQEALLLWALDQDAGINEIERQIAATQVGAEAFRFGLNITRTRAELLQSRGITADLARRGFSNVAREDDQLQRLARIHNLSPLSQAELEDFFFHEDPEVAKRRATTFQAALTQFQGTPGAQASRSGGLQSLVDIRRTV